VVAKVVVVANVTAFVKVVKELTFYNLYNNYN